MEKPISGDDEQRRAQTRASRVQSGLPAEETESERGRAQPRQTGEQQQQQQQENARRAEGE